MKNYNIYMPLLFILLINCSDLIGQQRKTNPHNATQEILSQIEAEMNSKYQGEFGLGVFFEMDKVLRDANKYFLEETIEDPYNQLEGYSIFSCGSYNSTFDSSIVGIYKDNQIVWDSGPVIYGSIDADITFCSDINLDGKVDVGLTASYFQTEYDNPNEDILYLWILSWDGENAEFINEYDSKTGKSSLVPGDYELYDYEADGIMEIAAYYSYIEDYNIFPPENLPPAYPYVSYGWNGSKYGLWPDIYQLKKGDSFPAIWIDPTIKAKVVEENESFRFNYTVTSGIDSRQKINKFYLTNTSVNSVLPDSKQGRGFEAALIPDTWLFRAWGLKEVLGPGESTNIYWYKGDGLPGLCRVYIAGITPVANTKGLSDAALIDDIYNNSIKIETIGLKELPTEFDSLETIDNLLEYADSSINLGWIKNQSTYTKYSDYLTTAKTALENEQISKARNALNSIITEVDIDSSANITSEAYALLKYNTEYLLEQLPKPVEGKGNLKLQDSQGNLLQGGSLMYYQGGWKDATDNGDGTFTIDADKINFSKLLL